MTRPTSAATPAHIRRLLFLLLLIMAAAGGTPFGPLSSFSMPRRTSRRSTRSARRRRPFPPLLYSHPSLSSTSSSTPSNVVESNEQRQQQYQRRQQQQQQQDTTVTMTTTTTTTSMTRTTASTTTTSSGIPKSSRIAKVQEEGLWTLRLIVACWMASMLTVTWEDVTMVHPMRIESSRAATSAVMVSHLGGPPPQSYNTWGRSTIRGMAFGQDERRSISHLADLEATEFENLKSYNEIMQDHRTKRVPMMFVGHQPINRVQEMWMSASTRAPGTTMTTTTTTTTNTPTRQDVVDATHHLQRALLTLQTCKQQAREYEWDQLRMTIDQPVFRSQLNRACYTLKHANQVLSNDVRDVVGFDWGSCAWRHCGALADVQESLDELEASVGVLEPFEALFVLDVVERSLRDMLAVIPPEFTVAVAEEPTVILPDYQPLKRMSDVSEVDRMDGMDRDYLDALAFLRSTE